MRREVILRPSASILMTGGDVDPNGSLYGGSAKMTLAEAWALEDTHPQVWPDGSYSYFWPNRLAGGSADQLVAFGPPPTLALFEKVTIEAHWDYSQSGPNNWLFPPDNANGPRAALLLRGRDGVTLHVGSDYTVEGADIAGMNCNQNQTCGAGYVGPHVQQWELTAHPEGGPFTFEDLSNVAAGIRLSAAGPAFDNSQGSFFKIRCFVVMIRLEVEDLGGFVTNIRQFNGLALRLLRTRRSTIVVSHPLVSASAADVGEVAFLSRGDQKTAGISGWGERKLERRPGYLTERTYWPGSLKVEDRFLDLHTLRCLFWGSFQNPLPWSPELSGITLLDRGEGWGTSRDQDAWTIRPGDGAALRVLPDYPNISRAGLHVHAAGQVEMVLQNSRLGKSPWSSSGVSGGLTMTEDQTLPLADELGYSDGLRFDFGGTPGAGGKVQAIGTIAASGGNVIHARARVRNVSAPTAGLELFVRRDLLRSSAPVTEYWDGSVWGTSPAYLAIPYDIPSGEVILDGIPCDTTADASPSYSVGVGRWSSSIANASFSAALVSVQSGGPSSGSPLVTLAATITRQADLVDLENASDSILKRDRGVVIAEAEIPWEGSAVGTVPLWTAIHTGGALDGVTVSGAGVVTFTRHQAGGDASVSVSLSTPLERGQVLRVWARYLDASGWREHAPFELAVGAALLDSSGVLLESSESQAAGITPDASTGDVVRIGADASGGAWGGPVRSLETRRNPIEGAEALWRV